jgi:hypothetical protein
MKIKTTKVFPEIPGESILDRRVRYWKWKRIQAKLEGRRVEYGRGISGNKKPTVVSLKTQLIEISQKLELLQKALTKAGIKLPKE